MDRSTDRSDLTGLHERQEQSSFAIAFSTPCYASLSENRMYAFNEAVCMLRLLDVSWTCTMKAVGGSPGSWQLHVLGPSKLSPVNRAFRGSDRNTSSDSLRIQQSSSIASGIIVESDSGYIRELSLATHKGVATLAGSATRRCICPLRKLNIFASRKPHTQPCSICCLEPSQ
jgi:hypothetical protein